MNVIFIGGKQIGVNCLKVLLENDIHPSIVIGNRDDHGLDFEWHESVIKVAQENKLTVEQKKLSDKTLQEHIKSINPTIIFCIGSTQIIPAEILSIPQLGSINIHPALLPKYRGRFSTAHAIFNGEKETGVTLQWMDEGIDTGPIILQEKITIEEYDTAKTLYEKFTTTGTHLFKQFLSLLLSQQYLPKISQDENQATYYPKGLPNKGEIDWQWSGKKIKNFIRAMTFEPFDPPFFYLGNKKMIIVEEKLYLKREHHENN